MREPLAGIVIPVFQKRYIKQAISVIFATTRQTEIAVCVVNDGQPSLRPELEELKRPGLVSVIQLDRNRGFAGANNAGWRHLLKEHPSLKYLGTINDDTVPREAWLDNMVRSLEAHPQTALAMPVMEQKANWWSPRKYYATWQFAGVPGTMVPDRSAIEEDTFVPAVNGFCFVARAEALRQVDYFDERYKNSCEDLDIGLKLITSGWRLVVCKCSVVFHYAGRSRGSREANTDCRFSRDLLSQKWGRDRTIYNRLDRDGFWESGGRGIAGKGSPV